MTVSFFSISVQEMAMSVRGEIAVEWLYRRLCPRKKANDSKKIPFFFQAFHTKDGGKSKQPPPSALHFLKTPSRRFSPSL